MNRSRISICTHNTFGMEPHAAWGSILPTLETLQLTAGIPAGIRCRGWCGGGSNVCLPAILPAWCCSTQLKGIRLREEATTGHCMSAAGEEWHGLVVWTLAQGWPGLENLALILARSAPPGAEYRAYGVEFAAIAIMSRRGMNPAAVGADSGR